MQELLPNSKISQGVPPQVFSVTATNNLYITTSTSYATIPGLSVTVSPTSPAIAVILTRGLMQANNDGLGFGDELSTVQVTIYHNGVPLTDATDIIDIPAGASYDPLWGVTGVWLQLANHWNIHAVLSLSAGVHTIDVRARNYSGSFDPFYVGGAPITPGPPPEAAVEGSLIVILFY